MLRPALDHGGRWCRHLLRCPGARALCTAQQQQQQQQAPPQPPPLRRQRQQPQRPEDQAASAAAPTFTVTAMALGERLDLRSLAQDLTEHGLYRAVPLPQELSGTALMATPREQYLVGGQRRDAVLFENGAVVFWNMSEQETRLAVQMFSLYVHKPHSQLDVSEQAESFPCCAYPGGGTRVKDDVIHLPSAREPETLVLDKFALSDALATSTRLGHLEQQLDRLARDLEPWIASLQEGENVRAPGERILSRTGQLYRLRFAASVCDSPPDFYWEHEELEALYGRMCGALSVGQRARLLNTRLQFCLDLCDLLRNQKHEQEGHRLEKIIIFLIFTEIMFAIVTLGMELSKRRAASK